MFESLAIVGAGALVFISAAVQHLNTAASRGVGFVFTDRSTPLTREGFSGRAARTLQNNVESAAMFVPLALVALMTGGGSALSTGAALVYLAARSGFTVSYWSGQNKLRSAFWVIGMGAIAATAFAAIIDLVG